MPWVSHEESQTHSALVLAAKATMGIATGVAGSAGGTAPHGTTSDSLDAEPASARNGAVSPHTS